MIRFVDLRHVDMGARFAFWDTVTDRFVDLDGCQAFDDLAELADYYSTSTKPFSWERLLGHLPEWALQSEPKHDSDAYRVAHIEERGALAPWGDFKEQPIQHGARLVHPDGNGFVAVRLSGHERENDAWRAVYDDGSVSRLCLQIGDKGRAVVEQP